MTRPFTRQEHHSDTSSSNSEEKLISHTTLSVSPSPPSMMYTPAKFSRFQILPPVLCTRRVYLQIGCLLLLALVVFLVRAMSAMRHTFVHYHLETDTDGELVILPQTFAAERGAFCLDGSPPAYYYRQSVVPAVRFWIIHLQTGGWCYSEQDCLARSQMQLGSSLQASISVSLGGMLSSDCSENPHFCMWHVVDLLYCDGGSFLGNRSDPVMVDSKLLYMRGAIVFDALIEYLSTHTLFKDAEQIILAGSSAGGLGALIHADRLRERLPTTVKTLHVIVDGSLFLDMPDAAGSHTMAAMLRDTFQLHHLQRSTTVKECTRMMNSEDEWRCILPEVYHKYVFCPVIFLNSLYDTWYRKHALRIDCSLEMCLSEYAREVHETAKRLIEEGHEILRAKKNGVFFTSCPAHTLLVHKGFTNLKSHGKTVQQALSAWVNDQGGSGNLIEFVSAEEGLKLCQ